MVVLVIVFSILTIYEVNALKCYVCDSTLQGPSCYDPLDESKVVALDCKDVYKYQRNVDDVNSHNTFEFKHPEKLQSWNSNLNPNWNTNSYSQPTDFECVRYEMLFTDGRRTYERRCQRKNRSPNFCAEMEYIGTYQGYKLNKCDICYSDYCNKSGSIKMSLLLNFAFFLIFYRCTD